MRRNALWLLRPTHAHGREAGDRNYAVDESRRGFPADEVRRREVPHGSDNERLESRENCTGASSSLRRRRGKTRTLEQICIVLE